MSLHHFWFLEPLDAACVGVDFHWWLAPFNSHLSICKLAHGVVIRCTVWNMVSKKTFTNTIGVAYVAKQYQLGLVSTLSLNALCEVALFLNALHGVALILNAVCGVALFLNALYGVADGLLRGGGDGGLRA